MAIERMRVQVRGAVQGVGFRPFVYGLATRLRLSGFVRNEPRGVAIELEGETAHIQAFLHELQTAPPPMAWLQGVEASPLEPTGAEGFSILTSVQAGGRTVLIPPDLAVCPDCLREMREPANRRFRYPFINCTNCGPRYTIIQGVPYDRARTTMAAFEMCPACHAEYEDPANRRFHAEPTCCPVCGPRVFMQDGYSNDLAPSNPIGAAIERLAAGEILAIKGLGGFHLACDASNAEAVRMLRRRKHRDMKPFALMARNIEAVSRFCELPWGAREILEGRERPILLLPKRPFHAIAEEAAPRSNTFGVMLPYTPLHHLLLEGPYLALVMTSGNMSQEPIAHENTEAKERLGGLADAFLLHDRGIHIRTDDSVGRIISGKMRFLRRSRGYAPFPVALPVKTGPCEILAVGAELNNVVCVTREGQAYLSHHIGDMENVPAYEAFLQAIAHLKDILDVEPGAVACDLHPSYLSTSYARESGLTLIQVQHHHAHVASVLAETGRTDKVIGVSFDGMGWGEDDKPWGGEFLMCDLAGFKRVGYLQPMPQPGGDAASKRPARMAYVYLKAAFGRQAELMAVELMPGFAQEEMNIVGSLLARTVNCPFTSSMGRLFDAASALLGVCHMNTYHAQAPMELEALASEEPDETGWYPVETSRDEAGAWVVHGADIVIGIVNDLRRGVEPSICAARFHNSAARLALDICRRVRDNTGISATVLSGGVFANAFLTERLMPLLAEDSFEILLNTDTPAGDGGICLGQAAVAARRLQCV